MSTNNHDDTALRPDARSPFYPPLRNMQWLDIYGTLSPDPIHTQGLAQLINMRGGLENIALPGLAATLSL
jgi:hypothetical protein